MYTFVSKSLKNGSYALVLSCQSKIRSPFSPKENKV